jgi:hypothetical protein
MAISLSSAMANAPFYCLGRADAAKYCLSHAGAAQYSIEPQRRSKSLLDRRGCYPVMLLVRAMVAAGDMIRRWWA